jgi:hypothetical protein
MKHFLCWTGTGFWALLNALWFSAAPIHQAYASSKIQAYPGVLRCLAAVEERSAGAIGLYVFQQTNVVLNTTQQDKPEWISLRKMTPALVDTILRASLTDEERKAFYMPLAELLPKWSERLGRSLSLASLLDEQLELATGEIEHPLWEIIDDWVHHQSGLDFISWAHQRFFEPLGIIERWNEQQPIGSRHVLSEGLLLNREGLQKLSHWLSEEYTWLALSDNIHPFWHIELFPDPALGVAYWLKDRNGQVLWIHPLSGLTVWAFIRQDEVVSQQQQLEMTELLNGIPAIAKHLVLPFPVVGEKAL